MTPQTAHASPPAALPALHSRKAARPSLLVARRRRITRRNVH